MRKILYVVVTLFLIALLPRQCMLLYSWYVAHNIVQDSIDPKLLNASKFVSNFYTDKRKSADSNMPSRLLWYLQQFNPYLTNHLLPTIIRVPPGSIELIIANNLGFGKGQCDSAARMLIVLLNRLGYEAKQLNIFSKLQGGHSAVEVTLKNGSKVLVDPYFSVIARYQSKLIGPSEIQELLTKNIDVEKLFLSYNRGDMAKKFYKHFDEYKYSYQGGGITLDIRLPQSASKKEYNIHNISPYLFYTGSRYDRSWTRAITSLSKVQIEFIFDEEVDQSLVKSNLSFKVVNNSISWTLGAGKTLYLYDKETPLRFIAANTYQVVKKIRITPFFEKRG